MQIAVVGTAYDLAKHFLRIVKPDYANNPKDPAATATHEDTCADSDISTDRQVRNILARRKEEEAALTEKQKIARDEKRKADAAEEANRQAEFDAARKTQAALTEKEQITRMENYRANVSTLSMPDIPSN